MNSLDITHNYSLKYEKVKEHNELLYFCELYRYNKHIGGFILSVDRDNCAYLSSFIIFEEFSNMGNGNVLSKSLIKFSKHLGIELIFLYANPYKHKRLDEERLVNFYKNKLNADIVDYLAEGPYMCITIKR